MHLDSLGMNRGDKPSQESQRLMEMVGGGLQIASTVATEHALGAGLHRGKDEDHSPKRT